METIKKQITDLLFSYAERSYGIGSCGEVGDAGVAIYSEMFDDLADEILQHFKDSSVGLNATDKPIEDLLHMFWQRSSDACPLECSEAEKQEAGFKEWIKTISWVLS